MLKVLNVEVQQQINKGLTLLKPVLGSDLLGIYLYGFSLVGVLQRYSDIALLVVTNRATTLGDWCRRLGNSSPAQRASTCNPACQVNLNDPYNVIKLTR
jgi:hypothetical protein